MNSSVSSFTKVIWSTLETSSIKGIAATTSSYFTNSQTTSGTANDSSISKPSGTQIFVLCVISVVGFIFFFLFFLSLFV
ncbi:PGA42, partial [Candida africana]